MEPRSSSKVNDLFVDFLLRESQIRPCIVQGTGNWNWVNYFLYACEGRREHALVQFHFWKE